MLISMSKKSDEIKPNTVIQYVRLGTLTVFEISEEELLKLEQGSPYSILLNLGFSLLSVGISFLITILTVPIVSERVYNTFLIATILGILSGVILLLIAWKHYKSNKSICTVIRNRFSTASNTPKVNESAPE